MCDFKLLYVQKIWTYAYISYNKMCYILSDYVL